MENLIITPTIVKFKKGSLYDFDFYLSFFNWNLKNSNITIDFRKCKYTNYQALTLYIPYVMFLKSRNNNIEILFNESINPDQSSNDIRKMWKNIGGNSWQEVMENPRSNFRFNESKPILAIRGYEDIKKAIERVDSATSNMNIEYEKSLRYILSELLYNAIEHSNSDKSVPPIFQFNHYSAKNEISFVVSDCGVGIKKHLSKVYPGLSNDVEAILKALKPQVSGTFYDSNPYKMQNNAGVGLFISSNIIRKLYADMYIISGNGLVHISPTEITTKTLSNFWQGTFIFVTIRLAKGTIFSLEQVMSSLRDEAKRENIKNETQHTNHYLNIVNYFGKFAEDKGEAISYRDKYLVEAVDQNQDIVIDFEGVINAPHSFLNALLSVPIQKLGLQAYKRIKIKNAEKNIRETIDFILDDYTR